jgi:hypothetical protein
MDEDANPTGNPIAMRVEREVPGLGLLEGEIVLVPPLVWLWTAQGARELHKYGLASGEMLVILRRSCGRGPLKRCAVANYGELLWAQVNGWLRRLPPDEAYALLQGWIRQGKRRRGHFGRTGGRPLLALLS